MFNVIEPRVSESLDGATKRNGRRARIAAVILATVSVGSLCATTTTAASISSGLHTDSGPRGLRVEGRPLSANFKGYAGESTQASWTVTSNSSIPTEYDSVFRVDRTSSAQLPEALEVYYFLAPSLAAQSRWGQPGWIDAGPLSRAASLQEACDSAGSFCPPRLPGHASSTLNVKLVLERPQVLRAAAHLDATLYVQYVPAT